MKSHSDQTSSNNHGEELGVTLTVPVASCLKNIAVYTVRTHTHTHTHGVTWWPLAPQHHITFSEQPPTHTHTLTLQSAAHLSRGLMTALKWNHSNHSRTVDLSWIRYAGYNISHRSSISQSTSSVLEVNKNWSAFSHSLPLSCLSGTLSASWFAPLIEDTRFICRTSGLINRDLHR